jgi:hypothetical protein
MACDLEREKAVPSLVDQMRLRWSPDGQAAQNEWTGRETEDLTSRFPFLAGQE